VLKLEQSETQFERTVRDKIACKTHLEFFLYVPLLSHLRYHWF